MLCEAHERPTVPLLSLRRCTGRLWELQAPSNGPLEYVNEICYQLDRKVLARAQCTRVLAIWLLIPAFLQSWLDLKINGSLKNIMLMIKQRGFIYTKMNQVPRHSWRGERHGKSYRKRSFVEYQHDDLPHSCNLFWTSWVSSIKCVLVAVARVC